MIGQVNTVDGNKTVLPLAGSIPVGNPVGSFLYTYKKLRPRNYLYCDGSTFDQNQYPALYLYLGSNVLPDYRECAMVGAEQNTTDTIAKHDVYSQGEFKDDQIQNVTGQIYIDELATGYGRGTFTPQGAFANLGDKGGTYTRYNSATGNYKIYDFDASRVARAGTTTHGKQKAVYVYIKAVDGVDISDEDTFLDTVKNFVEEKNSYSTTEMLTGGKWIDGKPIYRMCNYATGSVTVTATGSGTIPLSWFNTNVKSDVDTILKVETGQSGKGLISIWRNPTINTTGVNVTSQGGQGYGISTTTVIVIEYTKTTD